MSLAEFCNDEIMNIGVYFYVKMYCRETIDYVLDRTYAAPCILNLISNSLILYIITNIS